MNLTAVLLQPVWIQQRGDDEPRILCEKRTAHTFAKDAAQAGLIRPESVETVACDLVELLKPAYHATLGYTRVVRVSARRKASRLQ
jgi:hypothetical protein